MPQAHEDNQSLSAAVAALEKSFGEFTNAAELNQKSQSEATKAAMAEMAAKAATQFEQLQADNAKIRAAFERVAANDNDPKGLSDEERAHKAAFNKLLRKGDKHLNDIEIKALSTDSNPDGGYAVGREMLGTINGQIFETSPLRRVANVVTTSAKSVEMILDDQQAGFAWAGEGDSVSETTTPTMGKIEIVAKKAQAYPKATVEMIQDGVFDVEAWLARKIADRVARGENTAFVVGNGVSAPRGFLTYNPGAEGAAYARDTIEQVVNGSTSAVTENGLIKLQGSLKEGYQPRAVFAMKRSTFISVMQMAGTNLFRFLNLQPQTGPSGQALPSTLTLLEKPVILMDDMPTIASNALSIAYGDFSEDYTIVDRVGLSVTVDPYTAPGFIKYYATKRVGGGVTNFEALKTLKMATS